MVSMDPIEDIKSRLDVVDTVAEYLQLKPAGSGSFKACCPFHQEKTPSFFVNRPRQSWHCFGCAQGGDVISFVQKMEGMDFPEALELLAQKAGVTLPTFNVATTSERKRLIEVNELASKYFRAQLLQNPHAAHARAYVAKRGLDDLTCDLWRIGYAPDGWNNLTDALRAKGVIDDELIRAGLAIKRDSSHHPQTHSSLESHEDGDMGVSVYDRFRNRLMFTICDLHGKVVGFTGRVLDENAKEAKYVNTPETLLYKKSHILFGLDKAKGEIKRQDLVVIVEGNMDVITSHQFVVTNVVASSGTALTGEQLNLLKRFTTNLAIAFDADTAGNAATIRGLDLARGMDFNVRVLTLPSDAGKDPDEAIRKDVEIWKKSIGDAASIIDWLYRNAFRGRDATTPAGKQQIAGSLLGEFKRIHHAIERDAWVMRLAKDLDVSEEALRQELKARPVAAASSATATIRQAADSHSRHLIDSIDLREKPHRQALEERILAILGLKPELAELAEQSLQGYTFTLTTSEEVANYLAILADREFQDQSLDGLRRELEQTCALLRHAWIAEQRLQLEQEMRAAERLGDVDKISQLISRFQLLS